MKIAFIQLGSWGDNVNSTMMLKPIKNKYPGCTIHVHTTDLYASAFINNPHVDQIHTTSAANKAACFDLYNVIPKAVESSGLYDKVFIPAPILHQPPVGH
jgi:ADP-heptose:LPS heptosyltransferase